MAIRTLEIFRVNLLTPVSNMETSTSSPPVSPPMSHLSFETHRMCQARLPHAWVTGWVATFLEAQTTLTSVLLVGSLQPRWNQPEGNELGRIAPWNVAGAGITSPLGHMRATCLNSDDMGRPLWMQASKWLPTCKRLTRPGERTTGRHWAQAPVSWEYLKLHKM